MNLHGARILIVEDEALITMAAKDMVESLGGIVAGTASTIAAACEKILTTDLHCVMLDVNLRGMMSFPVAAALLERDIPFFFCTAYVHIFEGFEHIPRVTKPYSNETLAEGFRAALVGAPMGSFFVP